MISPRRDNALPTNWEASAHPGGSPGGADDDIVPVAMSANVVDGATFRVRLGGVPGIRYRLEYATALGEPWTPVGDDQSAVNGQVILEDAAAAPSGFYRIRAVRP